MELLYKDKRIIAVNKPIGVSSSSDESGSDDAMTMAARELVSMNENGALWLVHRLDNVTGGVLVYARNKGSAAALSTLFSEGRVEKEYFAVVEGEPGSATLIDYLLRDSVTGRAKVVNKGVKGAKPSSLEYVSLSTVLDVGKSLTLIRVSLDTGRFHQIRAQLSAKGHPLVGDGKYGSTVKRVRTPSLFCHRVAFTLDGNGYDISASPTLSEYPWSLFDKKYFGAEDDN